MEQTLKKINKDLIPSYVTHVTQTLENAGFEAFVVGGCVRDMFLGRDVKDWDLTTSATPEEIQGLFEKTVYENTFGTVGVCIPKDNTGAQLLGNSVSGETVKILDNTVSRDTNEQVSPETGSVQLDTRSQSLGAYFIVEVTPFRKEGKYSDNRHPDEVCYTRNVSEDLGRRDFTINAMAYSVEKDTITDLYNGQSDITDKIIKTVGSPIERFSEDALRMLRAVRFSTALDFAIEGETLAAIATNAHLMENISQERIRDEFVKIIESPRPAQGIALLQKLGLLKYIIPELEEGIGCHQGGAHLYDVFEHLLGALQHAADKGYSTDIRLSALFHDIGKPRTKRTPSTKAKPTFYGHEVVGAKMTKKILERMKFSRETIDYVTNMVRRHMFFSDTEQITLSAVRRVVANVGVDHIWELMQVRECDRVGMAKAEAPYRLRKYHAMIEECLRDPISVKQLAIDGNYLMNELQIKAGPRMGWMLNALLEEVLDDPSKNTIEILSERVKEYENMDDVTLKALGEKAKHQKDVLEQEEIMKLHKKHKV